MDLYDTIAFSMPQDFTLGLVGSDSINEGYWFIFTGQKMWIDVKGKLPVACPFSYVRRVYLGSLKEIECYAVEVEEEFSCFEGSWVSFRDLHGILSKKEYALAGRALQLLEWDRVHTYCGVCGGPTFSRSHERCRECKSCGQLAYPKLAPAVMALVQKEDKVLLARSPHFPEKMYSVLAGYLDVGETLEQCVIREVQEEVGLEVSNIRYVASQPWPFTGSLMIGFVCDWVSGEIVQDPVEIEDARWFTKQDLPLVPTEVSLAYYLIEYWKSQ
jgi:NAD+ diphosphatase